MSRYYNLGTLAIIGLVVLRFFVGYHFFMEGASKVKTGGFSSAGFLGSAVGPLANNFQRMLPDYDASVRTNGKEMREKYIAFGNSAIDHFGFDQNQKASTQNAVEAATTTLSATWKDYGREIREYRLGFARLDDLNGDPTRFGVESLSDQRIDIEKKWRASIKPILADIDSTSERLSQSVNAIATQDQRRAAGSYDFEVVDAGLMRVSMVDKIIPIFDMCVGILLMFGLLTPLAGIAAGCFLISVVLTQFPGAAGAQPTYYQAIEAAACFLLAFADAGRYAGLDFFPWMMWQRRAAANRQRQIVETVPVSNSTTAQPA